MMVTSYSKSDIDGELGDYIPLEVAAYNKYKKRFKPKTSSGIEGDYITPYTLFSDTNYFRLSVGKSAKICKDLFWHSNIW